MSKNKIYTRLPNNYYNYFDICKWENVATGTAKRCAAEGLESIANLAEIKEIGHQFKLFPKYENGILRNQYGILKSNYDFWKREGRAKKQSPGRTPKWKENEELTNMNIPIPKKLYDDFRAVIDKANDMSVVKVTYRDMVYVALQEWIDRRT